MTHEELIARARAWMETDPDPQTRAQTAAMLDDPHALRDHFGARLAFGTAGLRGALGPGPNRMNQALVHRVSDGLATHLLATYGAIRPVIIGYDGRHGSEVFARAASEVLAGRGLDVLLYDRVSPTPEVAHALVELDCLAAVVVTASHNPPQDNGYKVFWRNGAQIIPPTDAEIAAAIPDSWPEIGGGGGRIAPVPDVARSRYLEALDGLRVHRVTGARIVYSAMHGVGRDLLVRALHRAGHTDLHVVAEQAEPHADFPTVDFPNPEEPGALDLSYQLADAVEADLILANDPDADRLAVAVRHQGAWRQLTGNQTGVLLAEDLLEHGDATRPLVATTIVSTSMLQRIAAAHGADVVETLTGFKWIATAAIAWDQGGGSFVTGFEEALGYSIGPVVRDKDGISAALVVADLASWCKERDETLIDALTRLYRTHGVYLTSQRAAVMAGAEGAAKIAAIMQSLRDRDLAEIGGLAVARIRDMASGTAHTLATGEVSPIDLPRSNVLAWDLADGSRILARPSGTEPKIKFYFEVREPMEADETLEEAEHRAERKRVQLESAFSALAGLD